MFNTRLGWVLLGVYNVHCWSISPDGSRGDYRMNTEEYQKLLAGRDWVESTKFSFPAYFKVSDQFRILEAKNTANGIFSFLLFLHTSDLLLPAEINVVISDVGSDNAWSQCPALVLTMLNKSCETDAQCRSRTDNSVCLQVF